MKKCVLFAIAALFAGASQALTLVWSSSDASKQTGFQIDNGQAFTIVAKLVTSSSTGLLAAVSNTPLLLTNGSTDQLKVFNDGGWCNVNVKNDSTDWVAMGYNNATTIKNATELWVAITSDQTGKTSMAFYDSNKNVLQSGSWTDKNTGLTGFNTVTFATNVSGEVWYDTTYYTSIDAMTAQVTSVPEPTALALIALGIGAVALKRKAC